MATSRTHNSNATPDRQSNRAASDSGQQAPNIGTSLELYPTSPLETIESSGSGRGPGPAEAMPRMMSSFQTTQHDPKLTGATRPGNLTRNRTEKRQEQRYPVDDDYYALNPWYGQQPEKPLFSVSKPLPRTVRRGMKPPKRGPQDHFYKVGEQKRPGATRQGTEAVSAARDRDCQSRGTGVDCRSSAFDEDYFSNHHVREDIQNPPPSQDQVNGRGQRSAPTSHCEGDVGGQHHVLHRLHLNEADQVPGDRGINENGLQFSNTQSRQFNTFGLQQGLPQLHGTQTHQSGKSADTAQTIQRSQTREEKEEAERHEREDQEKFYNDYRNPLARLRARHPQALSEWLATTLYVFLGVASSLSIVTSGSENGGYPAQASCSGLAVMVGIYVGGGVSGAHLNPWISVSLSIYRGFPWRMCFMYMLVQIIAGICGGALAWAIYHDAIFHYDPELTPDITGKALYSIPQPWASKATTFFNDFVSMGVWTLIVFALGDDQNAPPGAGMNAFIIGLVTYLLTMSLGYNTGLGVNPARDFGPRLVALWAGYGKQTFTNGWWAYGPFGAGLAGSLTGGFIYDALVFVGGESPVNYRWPHPSGIKWKLWEKKDLTKEKLDGIIV